MDLDLDTIPMFFAVPNAFYGSICFCFLFSTPLVEDHSQGCQFFSSTRLAPGLLPRVFVQLGLSI